MTHPPRVLSRALVLLMTAGALALLPGAASAVDPVAGAQTAGDSMFPNVGNGGYDVSHYDIDMKWTPKSGSVLSPPQLPQSIVATTTITAATTGAPLESFSLDFRGLTVDSVTVNGVAAAYERVQSAAQIKYKLVVTPDTPVDGAFTTAVTYHGTPETHVDLDGSNEGWMETSDGATFLNQPVGAMTGFPNNNTNQDKATFSWSLDVPKTINGGDSAAISNGVLTSRSDPAGSPARWTWNWDVAKPMPPSLTMVSIGRYNMSTPVTGQDITLASGTVVKEWSFWDPAAANTGYSSTRNNLDNYLDFFEARYGPYPGNAIGIVSDNFSTGYALETQDRPFFPGSVSTPTNIHELMHQWFGNNVTPEYWSDLWLSEGPATYSEQQLPNENGTETSFYNQWSSTAANNATWTTPAANPADTTSADLYGTHVYQRGAMALEALRTAIGPTAFLATLREWQVRHGGTAQGTADFIDLAEEISGKDLTAFFQDWIYDNNKPAWPSKFNLSIASTPGSGTIAPGGGFSYTVSAANNGKVALANTQVTLDLSDVLDDATINGSLPNGTVLDGTTLTWTPTAAVGATATLTLPLTVDGDVVTGTLTAVAAPSAATLGGTCTTCTSSSLTAGLLALNPTSDPTITGTAKVGQTLTANTTGWMAGTAFGYQWKRGGVDIPGATSATYPVVADDLGTQLSVSATGSKPGYASSTRTSQPTASVVAGDQVLTPTPTVTGTAQVGQTLTAVPGTWDAGVVKGYQWTVDGADVSGATATTYVPVAGDVGKKITVRVTGTRPGYTTVSRTSALTASVATGDQSSTPTPTISGAVRVGEKVSVDAGTWDAGVTRYYQWMRNGVDIPGANGTTYGVVAGDASQRLSVRVAGVRPGYTTVVRTSAESDVLLGVLTSAPRPTITGKAKVGRKLTVKPGTWPAGVKLRYQWFVNGVLVEGATMTTVKLTRGLKGMRVTVKVTGSKPGYLPLTMTSKRTKRIVGGRSV